MIPLVLSVLFVLWCATAVSAVGLRTAAGSCTAAQRKRLVLVAKARGFDLDQLRDLAGGPLHELSAADASALIQRLSGAGLPHPPGGAPWPYKRRRSPSPRGRGQGEGERPVPRMVTRSHVEQIGRLMLRYFGGNQPAALAWFRKHWKVDGPEHLLTTEDAGNVIRVLKEMVERKEAAS